MKKIKKTKIIKALLASGLSLLFLGNAHAAVGSAHADVMSTTFNVSANIINPCTISATDMLFGNVTLSVGATATSQITIDCPAPITAYLRLNEGNHYSGGDGYRHLMQNVGGNDYFVSYELFSDLGMTEPFLHGFSGPYGGIGFTTEGGSWIVPVYGKIPVQAGVPSGTYTDIIQVTVDY